MESCKNQLPSKPGPLITEEKNETFQLKNNGTKIPYSGKDILNAIKGNVE